MKRGTKILLGIMIPLIIIGAGVGGFALWSFWPATWSKEAPLLEFPIADIAVIHVIGYYGYVPWGFHNGIDFACNASVNILAPCDVRVIDMKTWMYSTDPPDRWQTLVRFRTTWGYELSIAFESWALNESFSEIQKEAIPLKVNQKIARGEVLGMLLYHGGGCHIHFMIRQNGDDICPYPLFSEAAKAIFDPLFAQYGTGSTPCNDTAP